VRLGKPCGTTQIERQQRQESEIEEFKRALRVAMKADITQSILKLLACADLDQAMETAAELTMQLTASSAVAVLMWDHDMESFSDKAVFGSRKAELFELVERFTEQYEPAMQKVQGLDPADFAVDLKEGLSPLECYRVFEGQLLVACILIAGPSDDRLLELEDNLAQIPFAGALGRAWEFRELKRENERLRTQYEHLEDSISAMEEQTRKVIHDLTAKDALHTRKVERERLVYSISNAVRSSLRLQEVLQTAVDQIGRSLSVSRCILLRQLEPEVRLAAYEYHSNSQSSAVELFDSEAGLNFLRKAMTREALQDLHDPSTDTQSMYDREFLRRLGLRSGLIVPLILRDRKVGVIFLQDCESTRDWSIDDTALLGFLADLLSVSIENAELHQERERQSVTDGLTGVANRRHFNEAFILEFERAKRYEQPLSLIVADLDYLKKINDSFGHQVGDEAIKAIARVLHEGSRSIDLAARYGGEEFCVLLPNTELEMAEQTAERLLKKISEVELEGVGPISASIGVANFPAHADEPDGLFRQADEALYQAKQSGRNRVCVASKALAAPGGD
jgi:diguanylate cyclase (GGDEF)-like protein